MKQTDTEILQPISLQKQQKIREKAYKITHKAAKKMEQSIPDPEINFDLTGRAAGMCCRRQDHLWIRFNPYIFAKYYESNLRETVPHEVAHYLVAILFKDQQVQPHGKQWQMMIKLLGVKPERTHNYDLAGIPVKRQQRHLYHCGCTEHHLSSTRHNRVQSLQHSYHCKLCGHSLVYIKRSVAI